MRKMYTSVHQCFILLANLCKVPGTICYVFLAGKLRIKLFGEYKTLSGLKVVWNSFHAKCCKMRHYFKNAPLGTPDLTPWQ